MAVTAVVGGSALVAGIGLACVSARGAERATVGSGCEAAWQRFGGGTCMAARSLALRRRRLVQQIGQPCGIDGWCHPPPPRGVPAGRVAGRRRWHTTKQPSNNAFKGDLPNRGESKIMVASERWCDLYCFSAGTLTLALGGYVEHFDNDGQ